MWPKVICKINVMFLHLTLVKEHVCVSSNYDTLTYHVNLIEIHDVSFIVSFHTAIVMVCPAVTYLLCDKYTKQREIIIRTPSTIKISVPVLITVLSYHGCAETRRLISYKNSFCY
jgi:hypothetical protein